MAAEVFDRIIVQNNPVNFIDPYGLWTGWTGVSAVGSFIRGGNIGGGIAGEIGRGGGFYGTAGRTFGIAGSVGVEVGGFTGTADGRSGILTLGIGPWSIGFIFGEGIGLSGGISWGLPFELSFSLNNTAFIPWEEDPCP